MEAFIITVVGGILASAGWYYIQRGIEKRKVKKAEIEQEKMKDIEHKMLKEIQHTSRKMDAEDFKQQRSLKNKYKGTL